MCRSAAPRSTRVGVRWGTMALLLGAVVRLGAAELKPQTLEAFERYVAATEARMHTELAGDAPFLWVDRLPADDRDETHARLRAGEVVIERLETRDGRARIDIPNGAVHHWVGTIVIPGVTLDETIALVQDYGRYAEIYGPDVRDARLLEQDGARFRVYFQFFTDKIWPVVLNTEHEVEFRFLDDGRVHVPSRSTRILEVDHPDTPDEREKPEGHDRGTMWRFYNYCSFAPRDGDVYMQCESITLSRGIPLLLSVFLRPFINGVPREKLTSTLEATRQQLIR